MTKTLRGKYRILTGDALLDVRNIGVEYGGVFAVRGVSLTVEQGEFVSVIGANGAGKTTILRAISGLVHAHQGEIWFGSERIDRFPPHKIANRGIGHVPEGRRLFADMTVKENLLMGGYMRTRSEARKELDRIGSRFPILRERAGQRAGSLSGGEQQMLAIGRALMARPRLLLLDEPSVGLAPQIVAELGRIIAEISAEDRVSLILVEQNARLALRLADRAYVIELGEVALSGETRELVRDDRVRAAYLAG